jgi:hypothetical protein
LEKVVVAIKKKKSKPFGCPLLDCDAVDEFSVSVKGFAVDVALAIWGRADRWRGRDPEGHTGLSCLREKRSRAPSVCWTDKRNKIQRLFYFLFVLKSGNFISIYEVTHQLCN